MADRYRVIQWATGVVGSAALRGVIRHPRLELAGVIVSHAGGVLSEADAENLVCLRERLGEKLIGEVGPTAAREQVDPDDAGVGFVLREIVGPTAE